MDLLPAVREALHADESDVLSSPEKVRRLLDAVRSIPPTDAKMALALMALGKLLPLVQLPEDPAELDGLLEQGRAFLAALKSDPVPA